MEAIILIGMMGSGKTTIGRTLAEQLDVPFKDTDKLLQNFLGRPIHQLFRVFGEEAFRQHETKLLESLVPEPCVLSTGGGTPSREENWPHLQRLGKTVFLDVDMSVLKPRLAIAKKRRPLIEVDDWEDRLDKIIEERRALYERASVILRLKGEEPAEVVKMIRSELMI